MNFPKTRLKLEKGGTMIALLAPGIGLTDFTRHYQPVGSGLQTFRRKISAHVPFGTLPIPHRLRVIRD